MSDYDDAVDLINEAHRLPYGPVRVAVSQDSVRAADACGDEILAFEARLRHANTCTFSGAGDAMIVAFSWCLNRYQEDSELFEEFQYRLCWQFKHLHQALLGFPQISLNQIEQLFTEMENLYQWHGYALRAVHKLRYDLQDHLGNHARADELFAAFRALPRDEMSDCHACEHSAMVRYYSNRGQHKRALQEAEPLFRGELACAEVPAVNYSRSLRDLVALNRLEAADAFQAKGYRIIHANPGYLAEMGDQMAYLAFRGKLRDGLKIFCRHLEWTLTAPKLKDKFDFLRGAIWLLEDITEKVRGTGTQARLNLPQRFPLFAESGVYSAADLLDWVRTEAAELAARFDARNQTSHFTQERLKQIRYAPQANDG